ncbi:MAG: transposase [bacterium]|nr:transposase [bacterium]
MLRLHTRHDFTGSRHFVTTVTQVRGAWFVEASLCQRILEIFEECRATAKLDCVGFVLMPDHIHALLFQNEDARTVSDFMRDFKVKSAFRCLPEGYSQGNLWRRRYDDVPLPGPNAVRTRLKYMHENPLKARLVDRPEDYQWSSAQHYYNEQPTIITLASHLG